METPSQVLIVDDDALIRETLQAILSRQGYELLYATNGAEGLALVGRATFDLILLDVGLPDTSGFEVCRQLRLNPQLAEVPIIIITARGDRNARLEGIRAGADDFLVKPFDPIELRARVRLLTQLSHTRRLRKLEIQAERDRTQAILEALGEAVVVTDINGQIQYMNPAAEALTGFSFEEAQGQDASLWQSDRQTPGFYKETQIQTSARVSWQGETVIRHKDGTLYNIALTVAPLFDPHDAARPMGFVSVQRDITPLKKAERIKDQFISNVLHELRTPLSVMTLVTGNLERLYPRLGDEKRREMIADVREHTRVLNELIDGMLAMARLDSGQVGLKFEAVDIAQLLHEEVDKQLPLARKQGLTLRVTGATRLPARGDPLQLRQVMRNLINNAIKYTPHGGRITCEARALDGARGAPAQGTAPAAGDWPGYADLPPRRWIGWRVVDTGIGIAPDDLDCIFDRFYRVAAQSNIPGTGLGLSIARELVLEHGGDIKIVSAPGQGSTFAVYLPAGE